MFKKGAVIVLFGLIIFSIGFLVSDLFDKYVSNDTYAHGWNAAKERMYQSGVLEENERHPVKSVVGNIVTRSNQELIVDVKPISPFADPELDNRTVLLQENTKIFKYVKMSEEEIDAQKKSLEKQGILEEPQLYKKKEISRDVLQTGERIVIKSVDDDIRGKKKFVAAEIVVPQ